MVASVGHKQILSKARDEDQSILAKNIRWLRGTKAYVALVRNFLST